MNRREMLKNAAAGVMLAAAGAVLAEEKMEHHHHADHDHMHGGEKYQKLIDAAADSIKKGQICLQHCIDALSQGDKELGKCAMVVNDMLAACVAVQQLASYNSPHLPKMAKVASAICRDCEDECRKFEKKHEVCKASAEACAACYKECDKISA